CDGAGAVVSVVANGDLPVDNNPCTRDVCTNGTPSNPPLPSGAACSGGVYKGSGACVQCIAASDCPGQDTECQTRTCTGGTCGFSFAQAGTALTTQTAGDCQRLQCNGTGGTAQVADNSDLPVDNNPCTDDVCTSGVPSNPSLPTG